MTPVDHRLPVQRDRGVRGRGDAHVPQLALELVEALPGLLRVCGEGRIGQALAVGLLRLEQAARELLGACQSKRISGRGTSAYACWNSIGAPASSPFLWSARPSLARARASARQSVACAPAVVVRVAQALAHRPAQAVARSAVPTVAPRPPVPVLVASMPVHLLQRRGDHLA